MNFKKLFPIIICITMLLTIMVSAYSDEDNDIIQRTECGKNLQWKISGDTLIISGTGEMYSFNQHGSNIVLPPWYKQKYEHIIIENGVEDISSFAFSYEVFTSITIPNSVKEIGDYAFYDSCDLSDVYYQGTEAEWKKIKIYSENIYLETATIHFLQSETTPDTTGPVTTAPVTTAPVTTQSVTTSQDKGTTADTDVATGDTEDLTTDSEISSAPEITSPDTDMPVEDTEEIKDTTKDDSAPSAESKKYTSDENASVSTSDDTSDSEGTSTGIIVAAAGTIALAGGAGAFIFFKKYK